MWRTARWTLTTLALASPSLAQTAAPQPSAAQSAPAAASQNSTTSTQPAPSAQTAAPWAPPDHALDTLTLSDGTVLRGRVTELRPQQSVTVVLLTGEARTIPWSTLTAAHGPGMGSHAITPAGSATPPGSSLPPIAESDSRLATLRTPGAGRVPLTVLSPTRPQPLGVVLGRLTYSASATSAEPVSHELCRTPCTLFVRPGRFALHAGGGDTVATVTELYVPGDGLRVELHAASTGDLGIAGIFNSAGSAVLASGLGILLGTLLVLPLVPGPTEFFIAGGITAGVGIALLIPAAVISGRNPIGVRSIRPVGSPARPRRSVRIGVGSLTVVF